MYFSKNIYKDVKDKINLEEWNKCQNLLNSYPFLPISAVDEWGISSESTSSIDKIQRADSINRNILFLQTYKSHLKSFGEYVRTLANFFKQSFEGLILQPYVGRSQNFNTKLSFLKLADTIKIRNSPNLATLNFSDALKNLNQFQKDSRNILLQFFEEDVIEQLERKELEIFNQIFPLWYFFANTPQKIIPNAASRSREKTDQIFEKIRKSLLKKLRRLSSEQLKITIVSEDMLWEKESALWITADAECRF